MRTQPVITPTRLRTSCCKHEYTEPRPPEQTYTYDVVNETMFCNVCGQMSPWEPEQEEEEEW